MTRIAVAIDGSQASLAAVRKACAILGPDTVSIYLIAVKDYGVFGFRQRLGPHGPPSPPGGQGHLDRLRAHGHLGCGGRQAWPGRTGQSFLPACPKGQGGYDSRGETPGLRVRGRASGKLPALVGVPQRAASGPDSPSRRNLQIIWRLDLSNGSGCRVMMGRMTLGSGFFNDYPNRVAFHWNTGRELRTRL